jgi:hypothetical protein
VNSLLFASINPRTGRSSIEAKKAGRPTRSKHGRMQRMFQKGTPLFV